MILSGLLGGRLVLCGLSGLKEHVKLGSVEENWVKVMVETVKKDSNFRLEEIRSN